MRIKVINCITDPRLFIKFLLIVFSIVFLNTEHVYSQALAASHVTMNANDLKNGYIYLKIPIYDDDGNDEGISPTSDRAGRIKINDNTLLRFWSFHDVGDGQGDDDWYWVRAQRTTGDVSVYIYDTRGDDNWKSISAISSSFDSGNYTYVDIDKDGSTTWAQIRVCLPTWLLDDGTLNVDVSYYIDEDGGGDYGSTSTSQSFSGLTFPTPSLSYSFSSTPGKYDISASVSPVGVYSEYEYSIDGTNFTEFTSSPITIPVDALGTEQSKTVTIRYTLGYCSRTMTTTNSITLSAYPQAENFTVTQLANGNTSINWNVNTENLGSSPQTGDYFEIQRADNVEFNNPVAVDMVEYNTTRSTYSVTDETSEENLNGTYYYRIRRTKTSASWAWGGASTTSINLQMSHRNIASANAQLLEGNIAKITWSYDEGNVWTDGSSVVLERYNITNGGVKEVITVPADSLAGRSYSEELFQMCNKFTYKIYVKPGSSKYTTAEATTVQGNIVPIESGQLLSVNASKGYYSSRVELSWEADGLPIDYFIIKSRVYQSGNSFKQIQQVTGTDGSELYQATDEQANPGEIYEYQVIGVTNCADVTIYTDTLYTYGFRTPTGDIYGRVTFESGQAEKDVEVRLESDGSIVGKSLVFTSAETATVNDPGFLQNNADSITIQAWVAPDDYTGSRKIFSKPGMYELGIVDQYFYFSAGTDIVVSQEAVSGFLAGSDFVHVTGVSTGDSLFIYVNGERTDSIIQNGSVTGNTNHVTIGENFVGAVDEVRVWNRPLSAKEIKRDYNRYITGGEDGLIGYYTFNYTTENNFYDRSYKNSDYNENHGSLNGASSDETRIPTNDQLGYRGVTGEDGSYSIRAIPYSGNGTVYTIIPRLGIHQFEPEQEVRFIGEGSESFTVNFTDKSSFKVTGTVTYEGGTIPVQGVSFTIDGITAMDGKGNVLITDAHGEFEISVPVGSHEVIAKKNNHGFKNNGKITNSYGVELNYQDEVLGLELTDTTKIKYIGRVAGGAVQDSLALGHSLSTNNLADGITVTLATKNPAYEISSQDTTMIFEHFVPSSKKGTGWSKNNSVLYSQEDITIYPNVETGEFIAEVIPESFTVTVNVPGHDDIPGSGEDLNLTQQFTVSSVIYDYIDSTLVDTVWMKKQYSDTVSYQKAQKFIKRYSPEVRITQVNPNNNQSLAYFGNDTIAVTTLDGTSTDVPLYKYDSDDYVLGYPVFIQGKEYKLKAEIFEKYKYYNADGTLKTGREQDEIPTQDATVNYINNIAESSDTEASVEADDEGIAYYSFDTGEPELTSAKRRITATISFGSDASATSIPWEDPFDAIVLGYRQTGKNFVTAGPDEVLTILRDPPGSNSYSYLEKGTTSSSTKTYTGSVTQSGDETVTTGYKQEVVTFTGLGGGVINKTMETESGVSVGVEHEESYEGEDTKTTSTTLTTRFQTSSDESYVGADADVYIGYSTNISYGTTNNVTIVSKEQYGNGDDYELYDNITPVPSDWYLVQKTGLGVAQTFATLFAYSQRHIEDVLIPELINVRNSILMQPGQYTTEQLQQIANEKDTVLVVSKLEASDTNYGKSNYDACFNDPDFVGYDGPSYQIIFPADYEKSKNDTILYLNQTINNWIERMRENEEAKVNAELLQNYSFQGGASIEYSEQYSTQKSHESSFYIMIGANIGNDFDTKIFGAGVKFEFNESIQTTHGGSWTTEEEANHTKGFVLEESGDDYISVDVCREKDWDEESEEYNTGNFSEGSDVDVYGKDYYSSFIFKTKAGATSCPYEGEYTTKYFEPEKGHVIDEATMRIEVPEIAVEDDFIENVPSGGAAYFTLYLRNNSEVKQDNWFTLKIISGSNPYGAKMYIDGSPIGNGLDFSVPAGETLVKTLEVTKGSVLNYDNLKLALESQCESEIADTVIISVHYVPSCTDVEIEKPAGTFTYNTKLPTVSVDGVDQHYLDVRISGFDVNYDNFNHIKLQYKSSSESDDSWKTLMKYYNDSLLYQEAIDDGSNAAMINSGDAGTIKYNLKLDDLPDQLYDLRAVSVCEINNELVENTSETVGGIKDMYCPRLFGSPQPADGILTIEDDIRLNFNEQIADGLLTKNNFQVKGIRNGAQTDHSVSVHFDGINDYMATEFEKNQANKDITVEMWIKSDEVQNATLFTHGNINESIGMGLTNDNHLKLWVGSNEVTSNETVPFEAGSWAHVAFVYTKDGYITGYYNFSEVISNVYVGAYSGIGNFVLGSNITESDDFFTGYMHNVRVWNEERTSGELQLNSLSKLSGNELGLLAYYPMDETRGDIAEDDARGANMTLNGCTWTTPAGRSVYLNGSDSYVKINTGSSAVIKDDMDYTIEFWFKGEPGQTNATLFSNGRGDGQDNGGSDDLFSIGFNASGKLFFQNNGFTATVDGDYLDDDWHHFALNVGRTIGRGQIYVDGELLKYFSADDLGGIASAYMYIGVRGWYEDNTSATLILDNYFKGQIDEVRIWDLYKYEDQIQEYNNVKLDGEEMGLLAYYPFEYYKEWQGVEELDFTLADMKVQSDGASSVPDASGVNIEQVSDIPPVKDKGPVSDLEFDFVVNNDALIIYLEETPEKIEKTIVTFTVDGIQDVNGNENISPITWSAYIDRNMLKWGETSLTLTKPLDEALTFTVKAVNKGGAMENYTIQNMPSWMSVSPISGTIDPNSSIDVTFKIDEGLNVGTYNENIYLTNSDNVSEVLEVNVRAKGDTPDWNVNPANYEYNMQVYAKLRINNLFSKDPEDMIAAFSDGECIGKANVQYEERNDMWYAFLILYNNSVSHDNIVFKIWDASTGTVYYVDPGTSISFANNNTVGSPSNPRVFDAGNMVYQNIDLEPGWNWISFNVDAPAMNDLNELFADLNWDSGNFFKSEADNISANYSEIEGRWVSESSLTLKNELMYKVSSTVSQSVQVSGTQIKPSDTPINITGGQWNYIGYLPSVRQKVDEALAGYEASEEDVIKSQDEFAMYSGNIGWVGSLTYLEPGEGYMLNKKTNGNTTLTYPDNSGSLSTKNAEIWPVAEFVNHDYARNMNLIAVSNIESKTGDRILVYSGNELNAKATLHQINLQQLYFITVPGSAGEPVWFALERNGEILGRTNKSMPFAANTLNGTLNQPYLLQFENAEDILTAYPNPVRDEVTLSLLTQHSGEVTIRIIDISGRTVYIGQGASVVDGQSQTSVDCSELTPGMYFAQVTVEGVTQVVKIEKH